MELMGYDTFVVGYVDVVEKSDHVVCYPNWGLDCSSRMLTGP